MNAGDVEVKLRADTGDFINQLNSAKASLLGLGVGSVTLGNLLTDLTYKVTAFAKDIVMLPVTLSKMTLGMAELGEKFGNLSIKTGISVEQLSRMDYAAKINNTSIEAYVGGMRRLTMMMDNAATSSGEARNAFARLGIDVIDSTGRIKSLSVITEEMRTIFSRIPDVATRNALGARLMGRGFQELSVLMTMTTEEAKKLNAESDKLGVTWTGSQSRAADTLADNVTRLGAAWDGFKKTLAQHLFPILNQAVEKMLAWYNANEKLIKQKAIEYLDKMVSAIKGAAEYIGQLVGDMEKLGPSLELMGRLVTMAGQLVRPFVQLAAVLQETGFMIANQLDWWWQQFKLLGLRIDKMFIALPGTVIEYFWAAASGFAQMLVNFVGWSMDQLLSMAEKAANLIPDALGGARAKNAVTEMRMALAVTIGAGITDLQNLAKEGKATGDAMTAALGGKNIDKAINETIWKVKEASVGAHEHFIKLQKAWTTLITPEGTKNVETATAKTRGIGAAAKEAAKAVGEFEIALTQGGIGERVMLDTVASWAIASRQFQEAADLGKAIFEINGQAMDATTEHGAALVQEWLAAERAILDTKVALKQIAPDVAAALYGKMDVAGINLMIAKVKELGAAQQLRQQRQIEDLAPNVLNPPEKNSANAAEAAKLREQMFADWERAQQAVVLLESKRNTMFIANTGKETVAIEGLTQTQLHANVSIADSELRIAEIRDMSLFDKSGLRMQRLAVIDATLAAELDAHKGNNAQITADYKKAEADREGIARQYPTFWEKQLADIVASNVFSMSMLVSGFTSATAQWIVNGTKFTQWWQSLKVTMVQTGLQMLVQMGADQLKHWLQMEAAGAAAEQAKTAIFGAGEAARMTIAKASMLAMNLIMVGQLGAMLVMGMAVLEMAGAIAVAIYAIAMAEAAVLGATVVGAPAAVALSTAAGAMLAAAGTSVSMATAAMIASSTAATTSLTAGMAVPATAEGGVVMGPQVRLVGEAGPEAIIPLNQYGGNRSTTIIVEMDGKAILKHVANNLPSMLRLKGLPA